MVEHRNSEGAVRRRAKARGGGAQLLGAQRAALMAERAGRVQADDVHRLRRERRLRSLPLALELRPRPREPRWKRVGQVVVPRYGEHRGPEGAKEAGGVLMLLAPAAVREIARRDDERRLDPPR